MTNGAKRVQKHRDKMKAAGLKPVTIWVPDVNAPGYAEQVAEAIAIINASADEKVILEELSTVEIEGWK
jgi:Antitoxin MazE-like